MILRTGAKGGGLLNVLPVPSRRDARIARSCRHGAGSELPARRDGHEPDHRRHLGAPADRTLQYRETLPLEDHEVVLTFDDGPLPPYTPKVLDALAAECVKATFFIVGQQAEAYPDLLRREYREGHTIGTHTEHHRYLNR